MKAGEEKWPAADGTELVAQLQQHPSALTQPAVPCAPSLLLLEADCVDTAGQTGGRMGIISSFISADGSV